MTTRHVSKCTLGLDSHHVMVLHSPADPPLDVDYTGAVCSVLAPQA